MIIYDSITADQVDPDDLVMVEDDPIEVSEVSDEGSIITLTGYSHKTGDTTIYFLTADSVVHLWTEE